MSQFSSDHSRRTFLKTASLLPAVAASITTAAKATTPRGPAAKTSIPYVDGLCLEIPEVSKIRESGLTSYLIDVTTMGQAGRTFEGCLNAMMNAHNKVRGMQGVFIATSGKQIREAFKAGKTAIFFQVQGGGEITGDKVSRLDVLHEMGLRVFQMTHHHNNPLGGGGLEPQTTGLTKAGFEAVERLNALNMIPDLSHASDQTGMDTLKTSKKPVIISHGSARALVNNARCAADEVIRGIGQSGGVMGVFMMSFWLTNDPVPTVESYLKQIRHVIKVAGINAVGIANDYSLSGEQSLTRANNDNKEAVKGYMPWWDSQAKRGILGFDRIPEHIAIPELNNIRRMFLIHQALEKSGFKAAEVEKIMGGNWIRVLTASLP